MVANMYRNGSRNEDARDCVIESSAVEGRAFSWDEGLASLYLAVESRKSCSIFSDSLFEGKDVLDWYSERRVLMKDDV